MLGRPERSWDTGTDRPDVQASVWQQVASEAFVPVSLVLGDTMSDGVRSRCESLHVGALGVSWISSGAQVVERRSEHVERSPGGVYFVNLPLAGFGYATQLGRRSRARPGDFVVVDGDQPFELEYTGPFEQISLAVPHALLDPLMAQPSSGLALTVAGDHGVGAVASAAIRSLAEQRSVLDARETAGLVQHLAGLIALGVTAAAPPECRPGERILQAAVDDVERHLGDATLSIHAVAARTNVSTSYLTKLFADRGTTFGRWVLGRRLDRAWTALDPGLAHPHVTVTDIALSCGFRDSSHFTHAFRRRFGMTPTDRRTGPTGGDRAPQRPMSATLPPVTRSRSAGERPTSSPRRPPET